MSRFRSTSERGSATGLVVGGLGVVAVIAAILWFTVGYWQDASSRFWKWLFWDLIQSGFMPSLNPLHWTWVAWLCLGIILLIVAGLTRNIVVGIVGVVAFVLFIPVACLNVNDQSGSYAEGTTFVVEDIEQMPSSLKLLSSDGQPDLNGCDLYADNDMRGCIQAGKFNFSWDSRNSSAVGANIVISRSGGAMSNTVLMQDTLSYVYDKTGGSWTAIRDGINRQPIFGIASWTGSGDVTNCRFADDYALNKSFAGNWGTNLADDIADKYGRLFYDQSDMYGYCDGKKPIIVIPVKEKIVYKFRTAFRAAGVLTIEGSKSGKPVYKHVTNAKPGDFPGPVYPASLAKEQRESMGMIAGIGDSWTRNFGYNETDVETQSGNATEYQLRDKNTGRIYWVTPMKPRSSEAQVLVAYSVTPADVVTNGELNEQRIYVLPDGDPRAVNLDDLEARTVRALSLADTGFFTAGGRLAEFLPLDGQTWQVYAELKGRVAYRITVPTSARIQPKVTVLDDGGEAEQTGTTGSTPDSSEPTNPAKGSACVRDLKSLSDKALAQCAADLGNELKRRNP